MMRMVVEGWRFLPQSYALVNQFQCLELAGRSGIELFHRDVPFLFAHWRQRRGMLDASREDRLDKLREPPPLYEPDVTLRISFPMNFSPVGSGRLAVFGTSEFRVVPHNCVLGCRPVAEAMEESNAIVVTPSNWSKAGFVASGARQERVFVVPHGVDVEIFKRASDDRRREIRGGAGIQDEFVFLNIGAMTVTKNLGLLLEAFAVVCERHPEARLVLKGLDALYPSQKLLMETSRELTQAQRNALQMKISYQGGSLPLAAVADLYNLADAYVTPYAAEGFNLPALEAAASGLPVICTRGGATDDFISDDFALRVDAGMMPWRDDGFPAWKLDPDKDDLIEAMVRTIEDETFRKKARAAGPALAADRFTWKHAVNRLLNVLASGQGVG